MRTFKLALASVCLAASCVALANPVLLWSSNMDGSQETPPNDSPGLGFASGTYNTATRELIVESMIALDLTANITASHIHRGATGVPGPIIVDFAGGGFWSGDPSFYEYIQTGQLFVPPADVNNFLAGDTYINIHTQTFPGGELRGQVLIGGMRCSPGSVVVTRGVPFGDNALLDLWFDDDEYFVVQQRPQVSPALPNAEIVMTIPIIPNFGETDGILTVRMKANSLPFEHATCRQEIAIRDASTGQFVVVDSRKPENPTSDEPEIAIALDAADIARFKGDENGIQVAVRVFHGAPIFPGWTMSVDQVRLTLLR